MNKASCVHPVPPQSSSRASSNLQCASDDPEHKEQRCLLHLWVTTANQIQRVESFTFIQVKGRWKLRSQSSCTSEESRGLLACSHSVYSISRTTEKILLAIVSFWEREILRTLYSILLHEHNTNNEMGFCYWKCNFDVHLLFSSIAEKIHNTHIRRH